MHPVRMRGAHRPFESRAWRTGLSLILQFLPRAGSEPASLIAFRLSGRQVRGNLTRQGPVTMLIHGVAVRTRY